MKKKENTLAANKILVILMNDKSGKCELSKSLPETWRK